MDIFIYLRHKFKTRIHLCYASIAWPTNRGVLLIPIASDDLRVLLNKKYIRPIAPVYHKQKY